MSDRSSARCTFEECSASLIGRVVMAIVDQLCAEADIDIALLDALDYPLGESLSALHDFGILSVAVHVLHSELTVEISLASAAPVASAFLGGAAEVVESFFDVRPTEDAMGVKLIGSVG